MPTALRNAPVPIDDSGGALFTFKVKMAAESLLRLYQMPRLLRAAVT